jgi:hypothetical protein
MKEENPFKTHQVFVLNMVCRNKFEIKAISNMMLNDLKSYQKPKGTLIPAILSMD